MLTFRAASPTLLPRRHRGGLSSDGQRCVPRQGYLLSVKVRATLFRGTSRSATSLRATESRGRCDPEHQRQRSSGPNRQATRLRGPSMRGRRIRVEPQLAGARRNKQAIRTVRFNRSNRAEGPTRCFGAERTRQVAIVRRGTGHRNRRNQEFLRCGKTKPATTKI
jgi:hypothetical protein